MSDTTVTNILLIAALLGTFALGWIARSLLLIIT